jgi:hypothetical protein
VIGPERRRIIDRAGLTVLCLLLVLSLFLRVHTYRIDGVAPVAAAAEVDLGEGLHLSRAAATRRVIWVAACPRAVIVDFVSAVPHGRDASLIAPDDPDDRVAYVYRGQVLDGRYATTALSLLHFVRRAGAVMYLGEAVAWDELAVKLMVPANCDVSLQEVVNALRQDVRFWP